MSTRTPRTTPTPRPPRPAPSDRALRVAAVFGLRLDPSPSPRVPSAAPPVHLLARAAAAADLILDHFAAHPSARLALLTGPSGAGKSLLLRALARRLRDAALPCAAAADLPRQADRLRPIVDLTDLPLPQWLALLARAGLAEAPILTRRPVELSDGQRFRLRLALLMARAQTTTGAPCTLLIDEFASTLDRTTAHAVAASFRRWLAAESTLPAVPLKSSSSGDDFSAPPHPRAILAAANHDILEPLRPDLLIHLPLDAPPEVHTA